VDATAADVASVLSIIVAEEKDNEGGVQVLDSPLHYYHVTTLNGVPLSSQLGAYKTVRTGSITSTFLVRRSGNPEG